MCAGLAIDTKDLGAPIDPGTYRLLYRLAAGGIRDVYRWAVETYGFRPAHSGYLNKCDVCTEIRTHLACRTRETFAELKPGAFYTLSSA